MIRPEARSLGAVFGWPLVIGALSLAGLVIALFWEGPVDWLAGALLAAPVLATVIARVKRAR